MIKAAALLLNHIGYKNQAEKIENALILATQIDKKMIITGRDNGVTGEAFTNYILELMSNYNQVRSN